MFNIVGRKKTEWYEAVKFSDRPKTLNLKCRFYKPVETTSSEFYDLSGDDPDLYLAENCMALVEVEWVQPKQQYRIARDVVRMLDAKLVSLQ
jgi:hypothetical protein